MANPERFTLLTVTAEVAGIRSRLKDEGYLYGPGTGRVDIEGYFGEGEDGRGEV